MIAVSSSMSYMQNILAGIEIKARVKAGETLDCKTNCADCGKHLAKDEGMQINPLELLCDECWETLTSM